MNDAPVLSGANNFTTITEDQTTNAGNLVSDLIAGHVTDVDTGAVRASPSPASTAINGKWQYSLNAGSHVDRRGGRLGAPPRCCCVRSTRCGSCPTARNGSTDTITFRRLGPDRRHRRPAGDERRHARPTARTTPFSAAYGHFDDHRHRRERRPGVERRPTTSRRSPKTRRPTPATWFPDLIAGHVTDVDTGAVQGIAITALTATNGKWQYSLDAGSTWTDVGAVSDTSSLLLRSIDKVRFLPDGMNGGTDTISFRAWDQTGATAGQQERRSTRRPTAAPRPSAGPGRRRRSLSPT